MSSRFGFIKGVGFTLSLLAAYLCGFGRGRNYSRNCINDENNEQTSGQEAWSSTEEEDA